MWIDSHCHLNHEKIRAVGTPAEIVENARNAGVEGMLTICCRIAGEFPEVLQIARGFDNVWCSVGTHPHDAGLEAEKAISQEEIVALAADPKVIGIGESGLDYYYNNSSREDQQESFRKHIRACIAADLPLIVHARDADADIGAIIREEGAGTSLAGLMHCFSSGRALAEDMLDFGFYISFSGIVTFAQAEDLREIARAVPLERILVETDAPYLAPVPHRGKTNQPAYVTQTGAALANIHSISEENMATHSKQNFFKLFKKAKPV
jgi:TatD DNase family protein